MSEIGPVLNNHLSGPQTVQQSAERSPNGTPNAVEWVAPHREIPGRDAISLSPVSPQINVAVSLPDSKIRLSLGLVAEIQLVFRFQLLGLRAAELGRLGLDCRKCCFQEQDENSPENNRCLDSNRYSLRGCKDTGYPTPPGYTNRLNYIQLLLSSAGLQEKTVPA